MVSPSPRRIADPATEATFDGRADSFDRRSAPTADAARRIARAVIERSADGPLLDLGAGTGVIGARLGTLCRRSHRTYLGLDRSPAMLLCFRRRAPTMGGLLVADAGRPWPVADGCLGTIFAARVAHLLETEGLEREIRRVLRPGGVVLLGAVRRDHHSARSELRRLLHRTLADHGVEGRSARRRHGTLVERLAGRGAPEPQVVAEWTVEERIEEILDAWRRPGHLAGRHLSVDLRRKVLECLEDAARTRYDPQRVHRTQERFEIVAARP